MPEISPNDATLSCPAVQAPSCDTLIIGAGASGTMAGSQLHSLGYDVQVWEKARGVGGRMSTRRVTLPASHWEVSPETDPTVYYDHGAQFIRFASHNQPNQQDWYHHVQTWCQNPAVLTPWFSGDPAYPQPTLLTAETQPCHPYPDATLAWGGTQGMATLPKYLASTLNVQANLLVKHLQYHPEIPETPWLVTAEHTQDGSTIRGYAHDVVLTAPLPQTLTLLETIHKNAFSERFQQQLEAHTFAMRGVSYHPCYALMLTVPLQALADPLKALLPWPGVMPYEQLQAHGGLETPLGWVAVSQAKQLGKTLVDTQGQAWVSLTIQSAPEWSWQNLETSLDTVETALLKSLAHVVLHDWFIAKLLETPAPASSVLAHKALHRWRYSAVNPHTLSDTLHTLTQGKGYLQPLPGLWVAGDGLIGGRVEAALRSGYEVAQAIASATSA